MLRLGLVVCVLAGLVVAWPARCQSGTEKQPPGPAREIGGGVGTVAAGPVKAAGSVAKGGGAKAVGNAVTLHPIRAGESVVKGAGGAGKDVIAGTAKGTGKIVKGVGRGIKRIF